jgi:dihydrofolate synthase / folylpolyglutamate synthase
LKDRLPVPISAYDALESTSLPGRLQHIPGKVDLLIDVAHNLQSVKRLSETLKQRYRERRIHAVFSALADKPIAEMMYCLASEVFCWHIGSLGVARAASIRQLEEASVHSTCQSVLWYNSVSLAFDGAKAKVDVNDVVIVFGSFYTVAEVLICLSYTQSN